MILEPNSPYSPNTPNLHGNNRQPYAPGNSSYVNPKNPTYPTNPSNANYPGNQNYGNGQSIGYFTDVNRNGSTYYPNPNPNSGQCE